MHPYAKLTPGPGFNLARAAMYYAQRLAIAPGIRRAVARAIAAGVRAFIATDACEAFPAGIEGPCKAAVATLQREGFVSLGDVVSAAWLESIRDHLASRPVVEPGGERHALAQVRAGAASAAYPLEAILSSPAVLEIINHPKILCIASRYLGCVPTISSIGIRWSFPQSADAEDTQLFHRDPDDWRFIKLFVYLTDVDAESGPHEYVAGSHRTAGRFRARPYPPDEVARDYEGALRTIVGPAGTCFVADTYGIHRGVVPATRPRLLLQVQYSILPVYAFVYEPVVLTPWPPIDPYVNRLLVRPAA